MQQQSLQQLNFHQQQQQQQQQQVQKQLLHQPATKKAGKQAIKKRSGWKKPKDKPKRPLSAYNLFFRHEREQILKNTANPAYKPRRSHGKIGFAALARSVAEKWKSLDDETRAVFIGKAAVEKERYDREVDAWNRSRIAKMTSAALKSKTPSPLLSSPSPSSTRTVTPASPVLVMQFPNKQIPRAAAESNEQHMPFNGGPVFPGESNESLHTQTLGRSFYDVPSIHFKSKDLFGPISCEDPRELGGIFATNYLTVNTTTTATTHSNNVAAATDADFCPSGNNSSITPNVMGAMSLGSPLPTTTGSKVDCNRVDPAEEAHFFGDLVSTFDDDCLDLLSALTHTAV